MKLTDYFDRPIAFHRPLVNVCGSVTAALMLSQAIYWAKRCSTHDDGKNWFYKTQQEWEEETGLSRREQESARARLKQLGILEEKRCGVPAKLYFSIDFDMLFNALACTTKNGGNRHTEMAESDNLDCTKQPNCNGENRQSITENTTEITTENTNTPPNLLPEIGESSVAEKPKQARKSKSVPYQAVMEVYNETVGDRLPNAETLNEKRKRAIKRLLDELAKPTVDAARQYFEAFIERARPFYFGDNERGWAADFDYVLKSETLVKTREGTL